MKLTSKRELTYIALTFITMFLAGPMSAESLFDEKTYDSFVDDERAHRVGDVVTLLIVESARATSSQDSAADSTLDVSAGASKGVSNVGSANSGRAESAGANIGYSRDSAKATARQGNFRGQITVEVKEMDDTGKMRVEGKQKIVINGEEQIITLSGWLRPRDIDENNTALSLRLSDATIEYVGEKDENKKGLIRRTWGFVKKIW